MHYSVYIHINSKLISFFILLLHLPLINFAYILGNVNSLLELQSLSNLSCNKKYGVTGINNSRNDFLSTFSSSLHSKANCSSKERSCLQMKSSASPTLLPLTLGEGRVALVSGAGRGIGKCIAETLAKGGAKHVICLSRSEKSAVRTADEINDTLGNRTKTEGGHGQAEEEGATVAFGFGLDVSSRSEVYALCEKVLAQFGKIDILVNNAGITKDNLLLRMKDEDWDSVINTNLNSAYYFTRAIIRNMIKNKYGRIVNMSSVSGIGGNIGQCNYAASKSGLIGFTKSISKEFASRGITANCIAPGFIQSDMTNVLSDDIKKNVLSSIPAGRFGLPQEVADLAAFLCSENAAYISGKVIPIDGAMLFGNS